MSLLPFTSLMTEHCAGGHEALSQVWCPPLDAQGRLLSVPSVDLLGALAGLLEPVLPAASRFRQAREEPDYLLVLLALQVAVLCIAWRVAERMLAAHSKTFASIPHFKRMYVVANLAKSVILGLQAVSPSWWYYSYLHYRCSANYLLNKLDMTPLGPCEFDSVAGQTLWTKLVSATYVSTDIAALLVVPRLPATTIVHHIGTMLFGFFVLSSNFHEYPAGCKLMMYGFFATLAYAVNSFLALRVGFPGMRGLKLLAVVSAIIYALSCFVNWGLHLVWIAESVSKAEPSPDAILYFAAVFALLGVTFKAYLAPNLRFPSLRSINNVFIVAAAGFVVATLAENNYRVEAVLNTLQQMPLSVISVVYLLMIVTLVSDDLVLMKWLITFDPKHNLSEALKKRAEYAEKEKQKQKKTEAPQTSESAQDSTPTKAKSNGKAKIKAKTS